MFNESKNFLNLMKKRGRKPLGVLINKKPPKLNEKTKKKIDHLYFIQCLIQYFVRVKNFQNLAKKTGKKIGYLFWIRDF